MPHRRAPDIDGQYLLGCVAEESGEVIQIAGKILRHGWCSFSPLDAERTTNRELLAQECGDLIGAICFLADQGFIDADIVEQFTHARMDKLSQICPIDEIAPPEEQGDTLYPDPRRAPLARRFDR